MDPQVPGRPPQVGTPGPLQTWSHNTPHLSARRDAYGAYWLAKDAAVTAGSVTIVNHVVLNTKVSMEALTFHKDLVNGGGAQDEHISLEKGGDNDGGKMAWNAVFTAIQGASISRWDVTLNNFPTSGSDCDVLVWNNNGGAAGVVVVP